MAQQARQRDDGDRIQGEDNGRVQARRLDGNARRHEQQQDIDPAVAQGRLGVLAEADTAVFHPDPWTRVGGFSIFVFTGAGLGGCRALRARVHLPILLRARTTSLFVGGFGVRLAGGGGGGCCTAIRRVSFRPRTNPV